MTSARGAAGNSLAAVASGAGSSSNGTIIPPVRSSTR